jgi:TPP-dependent pyruvate/acetoin dehydrogenase alpha subunit
LYLRKSGKRMLDEDHDKQIKQKTKEEVIQALKSATNCIESMFIKEKFGPLTDLFTDVYDDVPKHLKEQQ